MTRYEIMPHHEQSDRAPTGVCELSIQAKTYKAFSIKNDLDSALRTNVDNSLSAKAFEYEDETESNRLVIYTGTDRLDLATVREVAEFYAQMMDYDRTNIPQSLSVIPTSNQVAEDEFFVWLEFKLEFELPHSEVESLVSKRIGDVELTPKNPIGENSEAILFRDKNVAHEQVRNILNRSSKINDALPLEYIRLVCEPIK